MIKYFKAGLFGGRLFRSGKLLGAVTAYLNANPITSFLGMMLNADVKIH